MSLALLARYLHDHGKYVVPDGGRTFYHRQLALAMSAIGIRVCWVRKEKRDHIWWLRMVVMVDARRYFSRRYGVGFVRSIAESVTHGHRDDDDTITRLLALELRRALASLGPRVAADAIVVGGSGWHFRAGFVWPVGQPGTWLKPNPRHPAPCPLLSRLFQTMRN